ncbi:hypothetical protein BDV3_003485 [Batrachochytrium dendrobatidis]
MLDYLPIYAAHKDPKIRQSVIQFVGYKTIVHQHEWSKRCNVLKNILESCIDSQTDMIAVKTAIVSLRELGKLAVRSDKKNVRSSNGPVSNPHIYSAQFTSVLEDFISRHSYSTNPFDTIMLIISICKIILETISTRSLVIENCLVDLVCTCPFEVVRLASVSLLDVYKVPISQDACKALVQLAENMMTEHQTLTRLKAASIWQLLYSRCKVTVNDSNQLSITDFNQTPDRMEMWLKAMNQLLCFQLKCCNESNILNSVGTGNTFHGTLEAIQVIFESKTASHTTSKESMENSIHLILCALSISSNYIIQHPTEYDDLVPDISNNGDTSERDLGSVVYACCWRSIKCSASIITLHTCLVSRLAKVPDIQNQGFDAKYANMCQHRAVKQLINVLATVRHWGVSQHLIKNFEIVCSTLQQSDKVTTTDELTLESILQEQIQICQEPVDIVRQDERYTGQFRIVCVLLSHLPSEVQLKHISPLVDRFQSWNAQNSDWSMATCISMLRLLVTDSVIGPNLPLWEMLEKTIQLLNDTKSFSWRSSLVLLFASLLKRLLSPVKGRVFPALNAPKIAQCAYQTLECLMSCRQSSIYSQIEFTPHTILIMLSELKAVHVKDIYEFSKIEELQARLVDFIMISRIGQLRQAAGRALATIVSHSDRPKILQSLLNAYTPHNNSSNQIHALLVSFSILTPESMDPQRGKELLASFALMLKHTLTTKTSAMLKSCLSEMFVLLMDTSWVHVIDESFLSILLLTRRYCTSLSLADRVIVRFSNKSMHTSSEIKAIVILNLSAGGASWFLSMKDLSFFEKNDIQDILLEIVSKISSINPASELHLLSDCLYDHLDAISAEALPSIYYALIPYLKPECQASDSIKCSLIRLLCNVLMKSQDLVEPNWQSRFSFMTNLVLCGESNDIYNAFDDTICAFSKEKIVDLSIHHIRCFMDIFLSPYLFKSAGHAAYSLDLVKMPVLGYMSRNMLIDHYFNAPQTRSIVMSSLISSIAVYLTQDSFAFTDLESRCIWIQKCFDAETFNDFATTVIGECTQLFWTSLSMHIRKTPISVLKQMRQQAVPVTYFPVLIAMVCSVVTLAVKTQSVLQLNVRLVEIQEAQGVFRLFNTCTKFSNLTLHLCSNKN